jgi:acyl-CoA thioesterase II
LPFAALAQPANPRKDRSMNDTRAEVEIEDLTETLALDPIEVNLFRGLPSRRDSGRIFGGHVIAQSLLAAYETVEDRVCHSLHCYFIRPGDPSIPILYDVDRARDGTSFTTRRVRAIQHGQQIFNLAASFQVVEEGFEHQSVPPEVTPPEGLAEFSFQQRAAEMTPQQAWLAARPIEQRMVNPRAPEEKAPPFCNLWIRARAEIGPDPHLHQALLAYASDMAMLDTAKRPHGVGWQSDGVQSASLDHALWFHRPSNFNDWHLFAQESPSASGARGFIRGQVFTREDVLVASVAQEGLMRRRPTA